MLAGSMRSPAFSRPFSPTLSASSLAFSPPIRALEPALLPSSGSFL